VIAHVLHVIKSTFEYAIFYLLQVAIKVYEQFRNKKIERHQATNELKV
jgi:hypothetical protein